MPNSLKPSLGNSKKIVQYWGHTRNSQAHNILLRNIYGVAACVRICVNNISFM